MQAWACAACVRIGFRMRRSERNAGIIVRMISGRIAHVRIRKTSVVFFSRSAAARVLATSPCSGKTFFS